MAVFAIVSASTGGDETETARESSTQTETEGRTSTERRSSGEQRTTTGETQTGTSTTPQSERKTYTVRPGDTLASIAEQTGVPVEELEELNPGVDSNSLSIGQEIRLAR